MHNTVGLRLAIDLNHSNTRSILGPLLFALVLHKLVASMEADDVCFDLLVPR